MKKNEWEIGFDKRFVRDDGLMDKYGFLKNGEQCFLADAIKEYISTLLAKQREDLIKEVREKFIELAIEGGKDRDELKGLSLYTRTLNYLDDVITYLKNEN